VARLRIERDGAFERDVELGTRDLRIGRDAGNDIVLDEPTKSVSRVHAELRCEQGRYAIIDLNSRNGIWLNDRQVSRVDLGPGVAVTIGVYRLSLEGAGASPAPAPAGGPELASTMVLEESPPPRATPLPGKARAAAAGGGPIAWLARQPKGLVFGGFAVLVVLLILVLSSIRPEPAAPPASPASPASPATAAPAPGSAPASNEQVVAELLNRARASLAAGDLDAAQERVQQALVVIPTHPEALDLRTKVDTERQRRPATPPGGAPGGAGADVRAGAGVSGDEPVQLEWEMASLEESVRRLRTDASRRAPQLERGVAELEETLRRVRTRLKLDGDDAYRRARQLEASGRRDEAYLLYQQALRFWPEDEPDRREARRRLEALGVGR
jgi:tetratricopeptide (TPR) repeat protein